MGQDTLHLSLFSDDKALFHSIHAIPTAQSPWDIGTDVGGGSQKQIGGEGDILGEIAPEKEELFPWVKFEAAVMSIYDQLIIGEGDVGVRYII